IMNTKETDFHSHLEFCNKVNNHIKQNWRQLGKIYFEGRFAKGLFYLANKAGISKPRCFRNNIYLPGGLVGRYGSLKHSSTFVEDKFYMINMRAFSQDLKEYHERTIQKDLFEHLDEHFGRSGFPEYVFLVDSTFNNVLANQYLTNGYSYVFVANSVNKFRYPTGTTILTKKALDTDLLSSLRILPYSKSYVNYQNFESGHDNFQDICLYSALFIQDQTGEYIGGYHQPAASRIEDRTIENLYQIQEFSIKGLKLKALMMDSNKYGVDTLDYSTWYKVKKFFTLRHPSTDFLPAMLNSVLGKSLNHKEIDDCKARIEANFEKYSLAIPQNHGSKAKTFHGLQKSPLEKNFANLVKYCLDLAIINCSNYKWFIREIKPDYSKRKDYLTDHSGILLEGLKK
ncbi:MAG: hypothetical protein ACRCXZ_02350, partial [Patescibacteria group bacterium]